MRAAIFARCTSILLMAVALAHSAPAQCEPNELAKLMASDASAEDGFGGSVSISGDVTVIGARRADVGGVSTGAAYVFRLNDEAWMQEAKLTASDGAEDDRFGASVSVSADLVLVGARFDDDACPDDPSCRSGSAYIFRFDPETATWQEEAKLTASDAERDDFFGGAVAISGDVAVIGAENADETPWGRGAAYVFRFDPESSQWIEEAKLTPAQPSGPLFGWSVSVSGDVALISAHGDDDNGPGSGSAYVYRFDGRDWVEETKLTASDGQYSDAFGWSVVVEDNLALIGAMNEGHTPGNWDGPGAAYVFRCIDDCEQWVEEAKLTASDGALDDRFGHSVSLSADVGVIGANGAHDAGPFTGSAYVFRFDGMNWIEEAKLSASDAAAEDQFGFSVSSSAEMAVIGARLDDDGGEDSGSAYVFHGLSDCQPNGILDICDIADGTSEDVNGNGIPDECECPGDLDNDGDTDHSDLGILLADWACDDPINGCEGDLNGDDKTDHADLGILLADWGCGTGP